jgi:prepilin-type processing-associated H-X9-DG protein
MNIATYNGINTQIHPLTVKDKSLIRHNAFFHESIRLVKAQPKHQPVLLVHPEDWERLQDAVHQRGFGDDVAVHCNWIVVWKFPYEVHNIFVFEGITLPVGTYPLQDDGWWPRTLDDHVLPKKSLVTKMRTNSVHHLESATNTKVAMISSTLFIRDLWHVTASEQQAVSTMFQQLSHTCGIYAFACVRNHHAIVLYLDGHVRMTPSRLAAVLRDPVRGPLVIDILRTAATTTSKLNAWHAAYLQTYAAALFESPRLLVPNLRIHEDGGVSKVHTGGTGWTLVAHNDQVSVTSTTGKHVLDIWDNAAPRLVAYPRLNRSANQLFVRHEDEKTSRFYLEHPQHGVVGLSESDQLVFADAETPLYFQETHFKVLSWNLDNLEVHTPYPDRFQLVFGSAWRMAFDVFATMETGVKEYDSMRAVLRETHDSFHGSKPHPNHYEQGQAVFWRRSRFKSKQTHTWPLVTGVAVVVVLQCRLTLKDVVVCALHLRSWPLCGPHNYQSIRNTQVQELIRHLNKEGYNDYDHTLLVMGTDRRALARAQAPVNEPRSAGPDQRALARTGPSVRAPVEQLCRACDLVDVYADQKTTHPDATTMLDSRWLVDFALVSRRTARVDHVVPTGRPTYTYSRDVVSDHHPLYFEISI